jgi:hypothetical protein
MAIRWILKAVAELADSPSGDIPERWRRLQPYRSTQRCAGLILDGECDVTDTQRVRRRVPVVALV